MITVFFLINKSQYYKNYKVILKINFSFIRVKGMAKVALPNLGF
jgi:hypothetical protein